VLCYVLVKILLIEVPLEGKEKKRKKVLLSAKIPAGGRQNKIYFELCR
jgi:hypothetical protein